VRPAGSSAGGFAAIIRHAFRDSTPKRHQAQPLLRLIVARDCRLHHTTIGL